MSKIKYTRSLALAAVSAALAGGVVSLSVSANAGLAPQDAVTTRVATDGPPDPIPSVNATGASSRKAGGDRADVRRMPLDDDAEDRRAIGNDALAQRALEVSGIEPAPAPAKPAPAAPGGQPAAGQSPGGRPAMSGQPAPSAQQAPVTRLPERQAPAAQQAPADQQAPAENPNALPAAQPAAAQSAPRAAGPDRSKAAPNPGIQGRPRATTGRGTVQRAKHAKSNRRSAARGPSRRPGAAANPEVEKSWRDMTSGSPSVADSMWNEPW